METPKKPVKNDAPKSTGAKKSDDNDTDDDLPAKKKVVDDDDDDYDMPLDDIGRYEPFDGYDEDDDY